MGQEIPNTIAKMRGVSFVLLMVAVVTFASANIDEEEYKPDGGKFLIGVRRTNVITTLSTSTVTVGATCYQQITTTTCSGKRKRRGLERKLDGISDDSYDGLDSSQSDNSAVLDTDGQLEKLVIWTTSTQTVTWFSSSTATGTTLTVAYSCTAAGVVLPPACG